MIPAEFDNDKILRHQSLCSNCEREAGSDDKEIYLGLPKESMSRLESVGECFVFIAWEFWSIHFTRCYFNTMPARVDLSFKLGFHYIAKCRKMSQSVTEFRFCNTLRRMETAVLRYCDTLQHSAIGVTEIENFLSLRQFATLCNTLRHFATLCDLMETRLQTVPFSCCVAQMYRFHVNGRPKRNNLTLFHCYNLILFSKLCK